MRNFLSLAVLGVLGMIQKVYSQTCSQSFIVIGAGVAGLGAARELQSKGCTVTVLEARNRTGGRINSVSLGSYQVDMGASWIHGIGPGAGSLSEYNGKMNPIYELTQEFNIGTTATWTDVENVEEKYYWWKNPGTSFD